MSDSVLLNRDAMKKKINKISIYLNKIDGRVGQLDKQLEKLHGGQTDDDFKKGMEYYDLSDNISREV